MQKQTVSAVSPKSKNSKKSFFTPPERGCISDDLLLVSEFHGIRYPSRPVPREPADAISYFAEARKYVRDRYKLSSREFESLVQTHKCCPLEARKILEACHTEVEIPLAS